MPNTGAFSKWVKLPGSKKGLAMGTELAEPIPPDESFEVSLHLRRKKPLPSLLTSKRPPKIMTRDEYARNHGANPADVTKVRRFAQHFGLQVHTVLPDERTVILSGTADAFTKAFKVELRKHRLPNGYSYRGREGEISIPEELANIVVGIFGLDNRPVVSRHVHFGAPRHASASTMAKFQTAGPITEFFPAQLAEIYNFPTDVDGSGQSIGIVELGGGFRHRDLAAYFQKEGVRLPNVNLATVQGGANNAPDPSASDLPDVEVLLDMEVVGSVAPGAKMVMYFVKDGSDQQTLRGVAAAVHDSAVNLSVLSLSWGGPEFDASEDGERGASVQKQYQDNLNDIFETAAHFGITVCVSSGDNASACMPLNDPQRPWDGKAHVSFPASSPYILACGGTHITDSSSNPPKEESWHPGPNDGTGGGISRYFPVPSYQSGIVKQSVVNPKGGTGRGVPDVAADAAQESGYCVLVDGEWYPDQAAQRPPIGGTSASAPLWAGLIALLNQSMRTRLGFVNPILYQLKAPGAFNDIKLGNNGDYRCAAGWDPCTGLGTPNGQKLLAALKAQMPAAGSGATRAVAPKPTARRAAAAAAAAKLPASLARHIIQFDAEDQSTYAPDSIRPAEVMRATARSPILWPQGLEPNPVPLTPAPSPDDPLPHADYLIVTWTTEEARCLADTLTPGYPSKTAWYHYTHNFESKFVPQITNPDAPAIKDSHRLGSYFKTTIKGKNVLCFKSELHLSQDGPKLPVQQLWKQIIHEVKPKLVITTGTGGGIGGAIELGDVVVAPSVRFDCTTKFKSAPFHSSSYACSSLHFSSFPTAETLFTANVSHLPPAKRGPKIFSQPAPGVDNTNIVTTDFFAFDDTDDTFALQGLGAAVEMGDAVLGLVVKELAAQAPKWVAVRNASDPQIDSGGLTLKDAGGKARQIYERYGYWTTIPSAITCWSIVLDN